MSYLGSDEDSGLGSGPDLRTWATFIKRNGGVVTRWPFPEDDYYGQLAARFPVDTYTALVEAHVFSPNATVALTSNNQYAYVLAPLRFLPSGFRAVSLGDDSDLGDAYSDWASYTQGAGGVATTWPFNTGIYGKYYGLSAARYTGAGYAAGANAGKIDTSVPTQSTANGQYIYVLASADVQQASPRTMTLWQRIQNAAFTGGDVAASKLGLPSLSGIETALKSSLVTLGVGAAVVAFLLFRRRD